MSKTLITPKFRVAFANVFNARTNDLSKKDEYSLNMLFDKDDDISELKKACKKAAIDKWGKDKDSWPKCLKQKIPTPFKNGDEAGYDGFKGKIYAPAKSQTKPGLVDRDLNAIIDQTPGGKNAFYSGCFAIAEISAFAWEVKAEKGAVMKAGVSFNLHNIQKVDDGESFVAGNSDPSDVFKKIPKDKEEDYEDDGEDDKFFEDDDNDDDDIE